MRSYGLAIALALSIVAFAPMTLRGDTATQCDPVLESPGTDLFIQPGTRLDLWWIRQGLCIPRPGGVCGVGFIVRDPDDGKLYATTAGHCIGNTPAGNVPTNFAAHPAHGVWGKVVYSGGSQTGSEPYKDIALIEIYPFYQDRVNASVYLFGGPEGMVQAGDVAPENGTVAHSGLPIVPMSPVVVPRVGILEWWNATEFVCTCATSKGDSGSPFVSLADGGKAMGLLYGKVDDLHPTGDPFIDSVAGTHVRGLMFASQLGIVKAQTAAWSNLALVEAELSPFGEVLAAQDP